MTSHGTDPSIDQRIDSDRTISELLDEPQQQDVPDEARVLPAALDDRTYEEVEELRRKGDAAASGDLA